LMGWATHGLGLIMWEYNGPTMLYINFRPNQR
jgi:hypothetical protein